MNFLQARRIMGLMNAPEPSLAERVSRLEIQVASMHAELKGLIETSVAELKGMLAALSARIDAQNMRLDDQSRRLDEHARCMDSLEAYMRKMNATIVITGISIAVSVILGVGAINSSLVSGMTAAFQAGDGSARWRANVERDVGELKRNFAEMDARQRRDSTAIEQQGQELREIRKLLERRMATQQPEPAKR
ncbi:hypothetical protein GTP41_16965 [Pseudoduganella sp. DS3]|uniref:Uncharacterized protein n=1 Tax=Pseudoduganella guangdongensis TaxID=2692179 RepID=A0A6N9HKB3_9BURK|nr:hypothetical protein [Pseudoduganella guangdongensis]MYN03786.1 hypothetical protein [Pseudoduganella guangdongensis]